MSVVFTHHPPAVVYKKPVPDLSCKLDTSDMQPSPNYNGRVAEPVVRESVIAWDTEWVAEQYAKIPEEFHAGIKAEYQAWLASGSVPSEGRRKANNYLLSAVDLFAGCSRKRLVAHEHNAQIASLQVQLFGLDVAAHWARSQGVKVPRFPKESRNQDPTKKNSREAVTKRLCSADWWERQLTKKFRRDAEAVQIRAGHVCKGISPYVSSEAVAAYQDRQLSLAAWRKQAVLLSNDGDEISMDGADHQHTAAFIQFAEFMVRVNGMSALAEGNYLRDDSIALLPDTLKMGKGGALSDVHHLSTLADCSGMVGICFTLTTPSRFHRYSTKPNKITLNPRYDKATTPADARDWLQETWKLTQTAWKRKTKYIQPIQGFGFRMDESHHDGVSHYHYAIWVQASDAQRATEIFYNKALRGAYTDCVKQRNVCQFGQAKDATEKGADVRRLNFKIMTSAKGMVSYMVKYITKGLTGADWEDLQAGAKSDETIMNLMARKSVWGLRQYAFWNVPSVMAWRELRRINDVQDNALLESARLAAKASDWKTFTEINGGATCAARQRPIRMMRKEKRDAESGVVHPVHGHVALNQYGEVIEQIRGLLVEGIEKQTRLKDWYLLNVGSLKSLLINKFLRESDTPKSALPVTFGDDIQSVIDQAKQQGKLTRLADRAGIVMFTPPPTAESSQGDLSPLGLVGITSHEIQQPPETLT